MNFYDRFRRFFTPPVFAEDAEKTRQARVLHLLTMNVGGVVCAAIIFGNAFIFTEKFFTTLILLATLCIVGMSAFLMHRGRVHTGSIVLVVMFWIVVTVLACISGGMRSYHATLYLSGTVVAGLLLGLPGSLIFGMAAIVSGLIMTIAANAGFKFPTLFPYPTGSLWIILLVNILIILFPLFITLHTLAEALERTRAELSDRRRAEETAKQRANETAFLHQLGLEVASGKDLYEMLYALQEQLMRIIAADAFYVALYEEHTDVVSYPIFFDEGKPLTDVSRRLSDNPGLTGAVIFNKKTLYLPDMMIQQVQEVYRPVDDKKLVLHSFLGVPLIVEHRVIGMLSVQSKKIDAYNETQIKLVEAMAAQAVMVIDKARLLDQLQAELIERKLAELAAREERDQLARRREMMEKVIELGKEIAHVTDLKECLRAAHQAIQKGLGFDRVGVFLYSHATNTIRGAFGTSRRGEPEDNSWFFQQAQENSAWQKALSDPRGVILEEDYQVRRNFKPDHEMYGVKQHVTLAAWAGDMPVAMITVDNVVTQREITAEQIEALRLLAGYIGLSIRNAQLNDDLERRVQERTAQLEAAMNELESFSYSVAHDLRAPLRGMRGFSQIVLAENAAALDERSANHLQRISDSARQMGELIDALLDFSRLTRLEIRREEINLSRLVRDLAEHLHDIEPQRNVHFDVQDDISVHADRRLMRIVLEQLLGNAWKFTSKKAQATIAFGVEVQNGERVCFVRDDGAGFNMDYAGKLFGAFQRLHHPDEFPGHGAGLAITKRIIQKHGGRIWAEGSVGQGATFHFTLA